MEGIAAAKQNAHPHAQAAVLITPGTKDAGSNEHKTQIADTKDALADPHPHWFLFHK